MGNLKYRRKIRRVEVQRWGNDQKIVKNPCFCVFNRILRFEKSYYWSKSVTGGILLCQGQSEKRTAPQSGKYGIFPVLSLISTLL